MKYLVSSFLLSYIMLVIMRPLYIKYLLDIPNSRSSHTSPTPRGAGMVFILVFLILYGLFRIEQDIFFYIIIFSIPIGLLGMLDDFLNVRSTIRLVLQILSGLFITLYLCTFFNADLMLSFFLLMPSLFLYSGIINAVNFFDGIDMLLSSYSIIVLISVLIKFNYPPAIIVLLSSLLCFSYFNRSPALIFLGDCGSTFLGSIFGALVIYNLIVKGDISFMLLLSPILLDIVYTLTRRLISRQNIFMPHRLHLYQRIYQYTNDTWFVMFVYCIPALLLGIFFIFSNKFLILSFSILLIPYGFILEKYTAMPFESNSNDHSVRSI